MDNGHCAIDPYHIKISHCFPHQRFAFGGISSGFRSTGSGIEVNIFQYGIGPGIYRPQGSGHTFHLFHILVGGKHPESVTIHKIITRLTIAHTEPSTEKIEPWNGIKWIYGLKTLLIVLIKIRQRIIGFIGTV
ncbi:hypothetical protein SDC9_140912 [bioreactor metagenome]|uniref:Uncharacterized protein n=1 Tax=bioreactor metagenome TaxID=1076179 RepID=A0A645DW85_9ZZZZ